MDQVLFQSSIRSLPLASRGKVRDNYYVGQDRLLMIATDRLSAFDVVMNDPIPGKGALLTQMSLFWFRRLEHIISNHLTQDSPENVVDETERPQVRHRALVVKRLKPVPVEAVIRGYLSGSAWKEYAECQSVCGVQLPSGLKEAAKLDEAIFTPATKAMAGSHDENIRFDELIKIVGQKTAANIKNISLQLYSFAAEFAQIRGLIIADTKFEFGLDEAGNLVLIDEVLTPDSSRYWPISSYAEGCSPPSFDKQFIRDWLEKELINGRHWDKRAPAPNLPEEIVRSTAEKYSEAFKRLTA